MGGINFKDRSIGFVSISNPVQTAAEALTLPIGHRLVTSGSKDSTADGGGVNAYSITGVLATDLVFCMIYEVGATPRSILTAIPTEDTITVTFSGDPGTDHKIKYFVFRVV